MAKPQEAAQGTARTMAMKGGGYYRLDSTFGFVVARVEDFLVVAIPRTVKPNPPVKPTLIWTDAAGEPDGRGGTVVTVGGVLYS